MISQVGGCCAKFKTGCAGAGAGAGAPLNPYETKILKSDQQCYRLDCFFSSLTTGFIATAAFSGDGAIRAGASPLSFEVAEGLTKTKEAMVIKSIK